jgi:excisionase family DNA binding protein
MERINITQITPIELEALIERTLMKALGKRSEVKKDQLLTVDQAAKFLNLTKATIYSKVSRNELPYMKQGKRVYFSSEDLMSFLKTGRSKTDAELKNEANSLFVQPKNNKRNG